MHLSSPTSHSLRSTTAAVLAGLALFEAAFIAAVKAALSFLAMCLALALIGVASLI